jgi:formamidopyrimidine-DNA glycosylase
MPELPEVETVANGVHARIAGARIDSVWCSGKPQTFKTPPERLEASLAGKVISRVRRVGKHIVVDLVKEPGQLLYAELLVHLGMTGRLLVSDGEVPMPKHTHLQLTLGDSRVLRFVDSRRFGRLELRELTLSTDHAGSAESAETSAEKVPVVEPFAGPGTEPLTITPDAFVALFRGRKLAIKAALLNQRLLHGVGNIYADESLFRSGIRPSLAAGKVSGPRLRRLHQELQLVLLQAIELGGSSVSDYVDADGVRGFFQLEHRVYGRTGQPCLICGMPIRRTVVGGRSTHSCPKCQK